MVEPTHEGHYGGREGWAEQVVRIDGKPLGLVWLYCPYPILARGLIDVLRDEARIHHGLKLPEGRPPSLVLFCAGSVEAIEPKVKSMQASVPEAPIVVFSMDNDLSFAQAALRAGARGYVHAGMKPAQVVRALTVSAGGEIAVPRELLKDLVTDERPIDLSVLTPRQQEICKLVVDGLTNAEIGRELFLSESTIKQHLRAAYKVLKVRNRTEAAKLLRGST